ncbi:hypothetical protein A0O30_00455 [Pseudomonas sp. LLC-1]|uniref:hypothetical protein n=1 Tax=Pseudomonas sp. LLC-1 TaxID=1812180 RepID=UPI000D017861|nr:hypothetical protein [Pseudomonas sp. LLC-1]PRN07364.1 hypothetical protein A0O30_00455 [Pseudomonas sp. LLC-1]
MLLDLDELILTCQDPRSKEYIREAVICYRSGAYRSAVVSCWIAVAFDLVDKIRELAASNDKMAQVEVLRFEKIQRDGDIKGALIFEKDLKDMALNKFEFVSHLEHIDLCRLYDDRNRCAHPSQVGDDGVFEATAELARMHIANSVRSILSRPAANGKSVLDTLIADIASRYFPTNLEKVVEFLKQGAFSRPRRSLYENLIRVMFKNLFEHQSAIPGMRALLTLKAAKIIHPEMWDGHVAAIFSKVASVQKDERGMNSLLALLVYNTSLGLWDALDDFERGRLITYVENAPVELLEDFEAVLDCGNPYLIKSAEVRIKNATLAELKRIPWIVFIPDQVLARVLALYRLAKSFAEANDVGKYLRNVIGDAREPAKFTAALLNAVLRNDQIKNSIELEGVLKAFGSAVGLINFKAECDEFGIDYAAMIEGE